MMEQLLEQVADRSERLVDDMLDAIDDKMTAMFGEEAVERDVNAVRIRARGLADRRLIDPELRFLMAGLR